MLARDNVDPDIYKGTLTTADFAGFVKVNNMWEEFRNVTSPGKYFFIGAVDDYAKESNVFLSSLQNMATAHAALDADKYIFLPNGR